MNQLLARLPHYQRSVFRADSGFIVGALMRLPDQGGHGYLPHQGGGQAAERGQATTHQTPRASPPSQVMRGPVGVESNCLKDR